MIKIIANRNDSKLKVFKVYILDYIYVCIYIYTVVAVDHTYQDDCLIGPNPYLQWILHLEGGNWGQVTETHRLT